MRNSIIALLLTTALSLVAQSNYGSAQTAGTGTTAGGAATGTGTTTGTGTATGSGTTTGSGSTSGSGTATGSGSATGTGTATGSGGVTGSGSATGQANGTVNTTAQAGNTHTHVDLTENSQYGDVIATLSDPEIYVSMDFPKVVVKHVKVIRLSKLNGAVAFKIGESERKNMVSLDEKLAANAALAAAIEKEGYHASDVVAVSGNESGDLLVFVDK